MIDQRDYEYLAGLVCELCELPKETEWLEFKRNQAEPREIGEYISALANAAALNGKASAYLIWGIDDGTHAIVGTSFSPAMAKTGNEPLEAWLHRLLTPPTHFRFFELSLAGQPVVVLEVERAFGYTVRFRNEDFIRVGEVKKRLRDAPERERELWRVLAQTPFESLSAAERVPAADVLRLLDYPAYFDLLNQPLPANAAGILEALANDRLIQPCPAGEWNITNLGALLLAKRLADFAALGRKAVRVIQYRGADRIQTLKEQVGGKGYASGFAELMGYINGLLPANEVIGQALRTTVPLFPELAIRELVANALIHQDFNITGAGPLVELFTDRIEITNPGAPLVDVQRFVDSSPRSRNEALASLMRRFGICEERGSGIDKVIFQVELFQLPAPLFEVPDGATRAVLFAHKLLAEMDKADRVRACYLHACLRYVMRQPMTNTSLRARFGIAQHNSATASRLIKEAVTAGVIRPYDEAASKQQMKYVPFWA